MDSGSIGPLFARPAHRKRLPTALQSALVVCVAIALGGCGLWKDEPPHIFLITIDTLRWDYLATYGYHEDDISPAVDRLAKNGVVFEQAVSAAGTTVPSHGTMLTGLYPRHHGARSNYHGLYQETRTVAQALTESGYQSAAVISYQGMVKHGKLGRGFGFVNAPFDHPDGQPVQSGETTVGQAAQWLSGVDPSLPIFMWLHLWEPHSPYEVSAWALERLGDYDGLLKNGVSVEHIRKDKRAILDSEENVRAMRVLYSGEVNRADFHLGRFIDLLERKGILGNSVIVFTADHGQAHGENGHIGHGPTHWETVIRVPLIIADFRKPESKRIATRVGTIDIAPTIAALAGTEEAFDWIGKSLLSPEDLDPERPYFAEVALRTSRQMRSPEEERWYDPNAVAVYSGNFKLESRKGKSFLFETRVDRATPARIQVGKQELALQNYLQGLIDEFREVELDLTPNDLPEEDLRELQGLGYVQ